MPFKVWAIGEEVLAADFQPFIADQVIATFPSAAARDAAITAPKTGQACYVTGAGLELWNGTRWISYTSPRGIIAHGTNGQPAANGIMNLSVVDGGEALWLAANTLTIPVGAGGLYLVALDCQWRSDAIVGIRFEVVNGASAPYAPNMTIGVSHNPSTWDPCRAGNAWVRQCADGDGFRVMNRGNAEPSPNYHGVARLSLTRLGDALALGAATRPGPEPPDEIASPKSDEGVPE